MVDHKGAHSSRRKLNAGTGRPAAFSHLAMALTTSRTAGRRVMRVRHSKSRGVAPVMGAP
jgi:uncharacterized protein (UPF0548 family)